MGLYLGDVNEWNRHNPKGNRESRDVIQLNNDILAYSGGSWSSVPGKVSWNAVHAASRQAIITRLRQSDRPFRGIKDPRILITYPFWADGLGHHNLVGVFRNPLSVARSLNARNSYISIEEGLDLWFLYNKILLDLFEQNNFPLVDFDVSAEDFYSSLQRVGDSLGMSATLNDVDFLDNSLRHHQIRKDVIPGQLDSMYNKLRSIYLAQLANYPVRG